MNQIGIMQGRLSPPYEGMIQSFPHLHWQKEFELANRIGFQCIEWVLDNNLEKNPLMYKNELNSIVELSDYHSIPVNAICCDYLMEQSLVSTNRSIRNSSYDTLVYLIEEVSSKLDICNIELPLIGKTGLGSKENWQEYLDILQSLRQYLDYSEVKLLIETDLNQEEMIEFFTYIETEKILINYDTGNSAYWGFDQLSEIGLYGHLIGSVHIKDCTPERYSVPLGEGNVDFPRIFSLLKRIDYSGDFILQMARGSDDYSTAQKSFSFTKKLLNNFFYGTSTSQ